MPTPEEHLENVRNAQNRLDEIQELIKNETRIYGRYTARWIGLRSLLTVAKDSLFEAQLDAGMKLDRMTRNLTVEDHSKALREQRKQIKKSRPRFSSD